MINKEGCFDILSVQLCKCTGRIGVFAATHCQAHWRQDPIRDCKCVPQAASTVHGRSLPRRFRVE